jgi:uncharacterized protein
MNNAQKLILKAIPIFFDHIYKKNSNGFTVLFNPFLLNGQGITVLPKSTSKLLSVINGKRTIQDCIRIGRERYNSSLSTMNDFFENLYSHNIIYSKGSLKTIVKKTSTEKKEIEFWVNLTNQCNFRCTYCFVNKNAKRISDDVVESMIEEVTKWKDSHPQTKVSLVLAGGEPLLEFKTIQKIIDRKLSLEKKGKNPFHVGIITNASLLTEQIAQYLHANKISIGISVDGIGKYHNYTRQFVNKKGTFKYVQKGISTALKYGILESLQVTVTTKNIEGLSEIAKFCLQNNLKMVFQFYKKFSDLGSEKLVGDIKLLKTNFRKLLKTVYLEYEKKHIQHSPLLDNNLVDGLKFFDGLSEYHCGAGLDYFSIMTNGDICLCPAKDIKIGSLKENNSIGNAQKNAEPIRSASSVEERKICQNCRWRYICDGGCMMERSYFSSSSHYYKCGIYKMLIPLVLEFEAKRIINLNLRNLL